MKLDKELYTKHAKRLQAILNEKSSFVPYITRADFSKVLENSLNTLHAIEKKLTKVDLDAKLSSKTLVKHFNTIGKNSFKINEDYKYEDEGDLIDNVNYLATYCKNIFKVNLDDLIQGKSVVASDPTINLRGKQDVEDMPEAGMGMGFGAMNAYENPFIMGKAYAKVKEDVATGKIYMYTSKPKQVVWAKLFSAITLGISIVVLIVAAIFAFMTANLHVLNSESKDVTFGFAATGPGIMYLLIACFAVYPTYLTIKGLISKNDNLKYYFNWPWILILVIMMLVFVMPDMRVTWLLSNQFAEGQIGTSAWQAWSNWKIMYIVVLASGGLCLIPMIIGAVFNPKQDKDALDKMLKQYVDHIMASSGFQQPTQPTSTEPKGEVQKPVEVKESKKTEKDSTDSKSKTKK